MTGSRLLPPLIQPNLRLRPKVKLDQQATGCSVPARIPLGRCAPSSEHRQVAPSGIAWTQFRAKRAAPWLKRGSVACSWGGGRHLFLLAPSDAHKASGALLARSDADFASERCWRLQTSTRHPAHCWRFGCRLRICALLTPLDAYSFVWPYRCRLGIRTGIDASWSRGTVERRTRNDEEFVICHYSSHSASS